MLRKISAWLPEEPGKSLLVALILLAPGSFLILPMLALFRLCARHGCKGAIQSLRDWIAKARGEVAHLFGRASTQEIKSI